MPLVSSRNHRRSGCLTKRGSSKPQMCVTNVPKMGLKMSLKCFFAPVYKSNGTFLDGL